MTTVHFWYDFSSPWTYLAATQVQHVVADAGGVLVWQPMLLGAVFKQVGTANLPVTTMPEAKRRWMLEDLSNWATYWNIPFRFASRFPMKTVTALRLALLADNDTIAPLSLEFFRALWVDDGDLNDKATLSAILEHHGMDPVKCLSRTQDPDLKQALVDQTSRAAQLGIFGAPTFIVENPQGDQLFWGQDRLDFVARAIHDQRPGRD